jgi:hypothetical protein
MFDCSVTLVLYYRLCIKKHDERETVILTMAVVTVMWGSSVNGDACLWVTIVLAFAKNLQNLKRKKERKKSEMVCTFWFCTGIGRILC